MYKISFFSYKGGSGRSSALVNTIPFVVRDLKADSDHPVVLLDMDVDSTGLTYLLHQGDKIKENLTVQKVMLNGVPGKNDRSKPLQEHAFFSKLLKVGQEFNMEPGAVLLLPAAAGIAVGRDGTNKNMTSRDTTHIEKIVDICEDYNCSAIVFDSSAGDQETATVSNEKADVIVCCMRPTIQFQEGTLDYFIRMNQRVRGRDVILLPNAVSRQKVEVDGKMYPLSAKNRIADAFTDVFPNTGNTIHLDTLYGDKFGVPLVQRFMWQETILYSIDTDKLSNDEKEALSMYEYLAALIVKFGNRDT